jgi:hypothetical protein
VLDIVASSPCPSCGSKLLEEIPTDFGSFYCCIQCREDLTGREKS